MYHRCVEHQWRQIERTESRKKRRRLWFPRQEKIGILASPERGDTRDLHSATWQIKGPSRCTTDRPHGDKAQTSHVCIHRIRLVYLRYWSYLCCSQAYFHYVSLCGSQRNNVWENVNQRSFFDSLSPKVQNSFLHKTNLVSCLNRWTAKLFNLKSSVDNYHGKSWQARNLKNFLGRKAFQKMMNQLFQSNAQNSERFGYFSLLL